MIKFTENITIRSVKPFICKNSTLSKLTELESSCAFIVKDIDSVKAEEFRIMGQVKGTAEYIKRFDGLLTRQKFRYSVQYWEGKYNENL